MTPIRVRTWAVAGLLLASAVTTAGCSGSGSGNGGGSAHDSSSGTHTPQRPSSGTVPTESNPPGDIPDNQAFVAYHPPGGGFILKVPEGWARTDKGGTTVFTDKLNRVQISPANVTSPPTVNSVTHQVIPLLHGQVAKFARPKVSQVDRKAGRVLLLTYQGDSAADPVTGKVVRDAFERYAFQRQGHEVDLTLSGPVKADNVDPWRTISDSFAWR
ncbi:hypothetical protein ABZ953_30280 [Streptomyces sp. NPDC046465]|uniref:hypothetical protein n=1 Tax=Streptomyces sp. NPDC046465 TaxID=3155810 RepID=UPI0033C1003F